MRDNRFITEKICVVIPTYNNDKTLVSVINDVLEYTDQIIVVNDGSTDGTMDALAFFTEIQVIHFEKNQGKGAALRMAFKQAFDKGFQYAISIDSDGQHYAKDLVHFLNKLPESRNSIIIGSRNMMQENVPGTSSFGNKFSNFWFQLETGIKVPDTQSGFRLYPLEALHKLWLFTWRYEFEIEVLVKAAWNQVNVLCIPIDVYYPPKEERITHFRKGPDFTRISFLNAYLVVLAFLFYKPRNFVLNFSENLKAFWYNHFLATHESNYIKAASVGLGVCMGIFPVWGFQMLIAVFIALYFKLNKVIVLVVSNISFGPLSIFWAFAGLFLGKKIIGGTLTFEEFKWVLTLEELQKSFLQFFVGGAVLAILLGLLSFLLTYCILQLARKENK
jgi:glycosyltransferase involved in cell wall biosynthesis